MGGERGLSINFMKSQKEHLIKQMHKEDYFEVSFLMHLGTTAACHRDTLDPELISALQNVSEVVCRFVDNNPTAWAPLICQVILTVFR